MTLAEIKENLQSLIVEDLGKALEKFKSILDSDSSYITPTILHQSNHSALKKEIANGTIPDARLNLTRNRIRAGLLDMINDLEEEDVNMVAAAESFKTSKGGQNDAPDNDVKQKPSGPIGVNSGIYISYAWGGDSEKIVDLLDTELQERNIKVIRDKRDLGYKGSITEFMKDIGKGNKVIVIISKKYLESDNCMFELTQVYENKDFKERIFPIVLKDADFYDPVKRGEYIKYWERKIVKLDEMIKSFERGTDILDLNKELNNYNKIRTLFSGISFILKDMNTLSPEVHKGQKFDTLYKMLLSS